MPKFVYPVAIIVVAIMVYLGYNVISVDYRINNYISLINDGLAFSFTLNLTTIDGNIQETFSIIGDDKCLHTNETPTIIEDWKLEQDGDFYIFTSIITSKNELYGISVVAKDYDIDNGVARSINLIPCGNSEIFACSTGLLPFKFSSAGDICSKYSSFPA